jgi:hypothetical protein
MADKKPMGFIIRVTTPGLAPEFYGLIADEPEKALVVVGDALGTTNEEVAIHQVLTEGLVRHHGIKPGHVKKIG